MSKNGKNDRGVAVLSPVVIIVKTIFTIKLFNFVNMRGKYKKDFFKTSYEYREYIKVHNWIKRIKGRATFCKRNPKHFSKIFHWANISGYYLYNVDDWIQLCPLCHKNFDSGIITIANVTRDRNIIIRKPRKDYSNKNPLQFYFNL